MGLGAGVGLGENLIKEKPKKVQLVVFSSKTETYPSYDNVLLYRNKNKKTNYRRDLRILKALQKYCKIMKKRYKTFHILFPTPYLPRFCLVFSSIFY